MAVLKRLGTVAAVAGLAAIGIAAAPHDANAWCCGVALVVPPVVVAPPVYTRPVYVAPPVVYAAPPAYYVVPRRVWIGPHWEGPYWVRGHWR
jgi:hypothetical protein